MVISFTEEIFNGKLQFLWCVFTVYASLIKTKSPKYFGLFQWIEREREEIDLQGVIVLLITCFEALQDVTKNILRRIWHPFKHLRWRIL